MGRLDKYLREVNIEVQNGKTTSALIALDPVSTSRMIENEFKAMLDFISTNDGPLGKVLHYAWRREYQTRGLQHFHIVIWIDQAPVLGESTNEQVAEFIAKTITCRLPDKNKFPTLFERVNTCQMHKDNSYCLRNKKTNTGLTNICRFGFPRPITDSFIVRDVATSIAGRRQLKTKSRLYDLPRNADETHIYDYNPAILLTWHGNMDIQFIGEISGALSSYVTKYQTKPEKTNTAQTFDVINSTKSLSNKLWNIGLRSFGNRECGSLEASDTLLGIPLFRTDPQTTIKWLGVSFNRNRRLKSKKDIEQLDTESTEIFYASLIDTHYPNRPLGLESLSLFEYARN